jgi:hypothetical protein
MADTEPATHEQKLPIAETTMSCYGGEIPG